jgi:hypothetical protein
LGGGGEQTNISVQNINSVQSIKDDKCINFMKNNRHLCCTSVTLTNFKIEELLTSPNNKKMYFFTKNLTSHYKFVLTVTSV